MTGLADALGLDAELLAGVVGGLRDRAWTVATAESLTAGLLAAALTEVPGSSAVVRGGLIVYATELKSALAGVDAELLERRGAVDPQVAVELARGAAARCGADVGVGLTGVAGPDPQDGHPVGTWYAAVTGPGGLLLTARGAGEGGTRQEVRTAVVRAALQLLRDAAASAPGSG